MPLAPGSSRATTSSNISEMVKAGYPQKQAVAASLNEARKSSRGGGKMARHSKKGGRKHKR